MTTFLPPKSASASGALRAGLTCTAVLLGLGGCAAPPAAREGGARAPLPPLQPAAAAPAPVAPAPPAAPPGVELARPVACTFDTPEWRGREEGTELALVAGGPAFVRVEQPAAELAIPVGPADDALLEVRDGGFRVQGHVAPSAVGLRPRAAFVLGGLAIPTPYATLGWSGAEAGSLEVTHEVPAELEVAAALSALRPCGEIGLDAGSFDAVLTVSRGVEVQPADVRLLAPGRSLELLAEPAGQRLGRVQASEPLFVNVHEARGSMSRVSLEVSTLVVFGWVKTAELKPATSLVGYGTGSGHLPRPVPDFAVQERWRCADDVPLVARVGSEERRVGVVEQGTLIEVLEREADAAAIRLYTKELHVRKAARMLVAAADLAACTRVD